MTFPEQLKAARTAAGLTQAAMAAKLGVDKTTYCGYETGRRQPDINKLRQLTALLDVSADQLLDTGGTGTVTPEELGWLRKYRLLDLHGRDLVDTILDKEYQRMARPQQAQRSESGWITYINCYDLSVSAGTGEPWVDAAYKTRLEIPGEMVPDKANFCVRVNGDSMEPAYKDGDIVFVERVEDGVKMGEIGIFFLNGDGYIKRLGDHELISLNPKYGPIPIKEYDTLWCQGRALGKLST